MRIDLSPSAPPSDVHIDLPPATQMVVISAVDGIIRDRSGSCDEARVALDLLAATYGFANFAVYSATFSSVAVAGSSACAISRL